MWSLMMFGLHPFAVKDGKLLLTFAPVLPAYLIGDEKRVEAIFLGKIPVCYHLTEKKDYIPGNYEVAEVVLTDQDGGQEKIEGGVLEEDQAMSVRDGKIARIDVVLK